MRGDCLISPKGLRKSARMMIEPTADFLPTSYHLMHETLMESGSKLIAMLSKESLPKHACTAKHPPPDRVTDGCFTPYGGPRLPYSFSMARNCDEE